MFEHSNESFLIIKKDNTNHKLSSDIVDSVVWKGNSSVQKIWRDKAGLGLRDDEMRPLFHC